jgi:hypothetical protein
VQADGALMECRSGVGHEVDDCDSGANIASVPTRTSLVTLETGSSKQTGKRNKGKVSFRSKLTVMHYFKTKPASAVAANVLQEENSQPKEDCSSSNWFSQLKGIPSVTYKASK